MPDDRGGWIRERLLEGQAIAAHPLALTGDRKLDERRQRALTRYYVAAGAGGLAVGVHTTQFAIRSPEHRLLQPVLDLARSTAAESDWRGLLVAGVCGRTAQAVAEAEMARAIGYHAGLLSLGAWQSDPEDALLDHCEAVGQVLSLFGFYLQPSVGGRPLSYPFWRRFLEISEVVAIKVAPFSRYATLDVVRALGDSGRTDVALYTGNDDSIVVDLLTRFSVGNRDILFAGGLLGHWSYGTRSAVRMLAAARTAREQPLLEPDWLQRAARVTEINAAVFDPEHGFAGCISGIHEVLRRQGLLAGAAALEAGETLSPGQAEAIDRIFALYPDELDVKFIADHREEWLRP